MRFKQYRSSPTAIAQAQVLGILGDIPRRLSRMARRAAPFTADNANRRFNDYGLQIVDDLVTGVFFIDYEAT